MMPRERNIPEVPPALNRLVEDKILLMKILRGIPDRVHIQTFTQALESVKSATTAPISNNLVVAIARKHGYFESIEDLEKKGKKQTYLSHDILSAHTVKRQSFDERRQNTRRDKKLEILRSMKHLLTHNSLIKRIVIDLEGGSSTEDLRLCVDAFEISSEDKLSKELKNAAIKRVERKWNTDMKTEAAQIAIIFELSQEEMERISPELPKAVEKEKIKVIVEGLAGSMSPKDLDIYVHASGISSKDKLSKGLKSAAIGRVKRNWIMNMKAEAARIAVIFELSQEEMERISPELPKAVEKEKQ